MKTVAIVQARMGSQRLPGKILTNLGHHPTIAWVVRAVRAAPGVDEVVIATSTLKGDDIVEIWCKDNGVSVFRGSETDVLARYHGAAKEFGADIVLRLTCDCPFLDPRVIGDAVRLLKSTKSDYCTNISPPTFPDGLDVEVFTRKALDAAHHEASDKMDRDCATQFLERNRSRFPSQTVICPIPGMHHERWVLDTAEDLSFCRAIAEEFDDWDKCTPPSYLDILNFLDKNPQLRKINGHLKRNERFFDALATDKRASYSFYRSNKIFDRALKTVPLAAQTFSKSHVQYPAHNSPLFLSHGDGGYCFDVDGHRYVDLVGALLPNILGYRDPDVDFAVRSQLNSGISFSLATDLECQLAERLVRHIPCAEMARFGKNGADVTAAAVRLSRAITGRDKIMLIGSGYHGWHDWSIVTTPRKLGIPQREENLSVRVHDNLDSVKGAIQRSHTQPKRDHYAAIIVEPEGKSKHFLEGLRDLATDNNIILIFDEVITGFRWGLGGYQKYIGVTPDLATFGKAMGNGMPISAIVGPKEYMCRFEPPDNIFYSGTFFGEALSLAASIATIDKLERERVLQKMWARGEILKSGVIQIRDSHKLSDVVKVFGDAPRVHIEFNDWGKLSKEQIKSVWTQEMIQAGVLIISTHNLCYGHDEPELKRVFYAYDRAFKAIEKVLASGVVNGATVSAAASVR